MGKMLEKYIDNKYGVQQKQEGKSFSKKKKGQISGTVVV